MDYRKNPSDNDQSWLESSADNSAIRWHGFDNLNNGKDKFFKADILPNNPKVLIEEGVSTGVGSRFLAGVYGESENLPDSDFGMPLYKSGFPLAFPFPMG